MAEKVFLFIVLVLLAAIAGVAPFGGWAFLTHLEPASPPIVTVTLAMVMFLSVIIGNELLTIYKEEAKKYRRTFVDDVVREGACFVGSAFGLGVIFLALAFTSTTERAFTFFYWVGTVCWLASLVMFLAYVADVAKTARS